MRHRRNLPFLHTFEAVARLGFVRSAAVELHVTPGAVSHQIRSLEEELGVALFARERRRLVLTEAGRALRRAAGDAFTALDACLETIASRQQDQLPGRALSVSVTPALGAAWVTSRLLEFAEATGIDDLQVRMALEVAQVDWRLTDVAVVYDTPPWPGYRWELLADVSLRPVCSPRLLNGPLALRSPSDVIDHRLLHEDDGTEWTRWLGAAKVVRPPTRNAHFGSLTMALIAALEGSGIALLSDFLAQEPLRDGRLVAPFDVHIPGSRSYYCVCRESRSDDAHVRRTIDWLTKHARGGAP